MAQVMREGPMSLTTPQLTAVTAGRRWAGTRAWPAIRKFIVTKPLGAAGGVIILLMVLTAIFADVLTPYDPYTVNQRVQFTAPSLSYWFGTDEFGRDVFTRPDGPFRRDRRGHGHGKATAAAAAGLLLMGIVPSVRALRRRRRGDDTR